jgi:hypothetical protein
MMFQILLNSYTNLAGYICLVCVEAILALNMNAIFICSWVELYMVEKLFY